MVITDFLERNARLYGSDIALVEVNPSEERDSAVTWREASLIAEAQPDAQGSLPYLLACLNPAASAYALCVLPCTQPGRLYHEPLCRISLGTLDANLPIGLFGRYESCRLSFDSNVENRRVFVQDLAAREAVDVTDRVALSGPSLTLPGALVERLCAVNQPAGDTSSPAVVVTLA